VIRGVSGVSADLVAELAAAGVPTPEVDARLLERFARDSGADLSSLVARRVAREPLQLIVGSVGFRYLDLLVRPGVFIPRPETEVLAGLAIERVPSGGTVVEPCTGTGAVACTVATEASPSLVVATDVSPAAVVLARENAARTGAFAVQVLEGDLLAPVDPALRGAVDVIVSNPPYLASADLASCEPEVRDWDPHPALVAGPTGLEGTARLSIAATEWLKPGGTLLLEIDPRRAPAHAEQARAAGLRNVRVLPDLTQSPRVLAAEV
jgi:release factor glutamine methyltransferase